MQGNTWQSPPNILKSGRPAKLTYIMPPFNSLHGRAVGLLQQLHIVAYASAIQAVTGSMDA